MAQRLKGQEVVVSFAGPNGSEEGLTDVQSFEAEFQMEVLTEGFLGETADRLDDIYRKTTGNIGIQLETGQYFDFLQRVVNRARRRTSASGQFNVTASMSFPNGERRRIRFNNVFFGAMPLNTASRDGYTTATINWESSEFDVI